MIVSILYGMAMHIAHLLAIHVDTYTGRSGDPEIGPDLLYHSTSKVAIKKIRTLYPLSGVGDDLTTLCMQIYLYRHV